MPIAQAEAALARMGRLGAEDALCTPEGRTQFRAAVRAVAKARAAEGAEWPNVRGMLDGAHTPDALETTVLAAVAAGVASPSDLQGEARAVGRLFTLAAFLHGQGDTLRNGLRAACVEVMALHRTLVRASVDMKRLERAIERAEERGDRARIARLARDAHEDHERFRRELELGVARIKAKLDAANAA